MNRTDLREIASQIMSLEDAGREEEADLLFGDLSEDDGLLVNEILWEMENETDKMI